MKTSSGPGGRDVVIAGVLLAIAALLAYANSFAVPLIFDDWVTIQHNPKLRQLWPIWEVFQPPEYSGVGGRPVANLVFVLNYALTGESMAGFHFFNLVLHLAAGLTLFGVVRRTLARGDWLRERAREATWVAAAVAAWWTLQPVQTQSVTYVSQRTEVLMGLFYFLTLYGFVRATEAGAGNGWRIVSMVCCAAGMASKEGMATAPVMVFLYDVAFVAGSWREAWSRRWRFHLSLCASWILLALLLGGLRGRGVGFGLGLDAFSYLLIECGAVLRYLTLGLWPWPLVFDYGTDLGGIGVTQWASAAVLVALGGATLWAWGRKPAWGFVGAWFFVTLAPTSSIVPIPLQPISENRVYVPLAAVATATALGLYGALGRRSGWVLGAAAVALGALTLARNRDYRSEVSIWSDTVAKRPDSSRAYNNLGHAFQAVGKLPEARAAHEKAIQLRPTYGEAHANLAAVLGRMGQVDGAIAYSRRATELEPKNANAFYNLGIGLRTKGQHAEAIQAFQTAIALKADYAEAHDNLAVTFLQVGRAAEGLAHSEAAVRIKPGWPEARYTLACALLLAGRAADAVPIFQEFLRLRPNHLEAYQNFGAALLQLNRPKEAAEVYQLMLRLDPNHAFARQMLEKLGGAPAASKTP